MIELLPIKERLEDNKDFLANPDCKDTLEMTVTFFASIGYRPPWIGYYAFMDNQLVGSAAFKGRPKDNKVEIAYGTILRFMNQGIGTQICRALVDLALITDSSVTITARTLPEENFSARILRKNHFKLMGTVIDVDDGEVWEWEYQVTPL